MMNESNLIQELDILYTSIEKRKRSNYKDLEMFDELFQNSKTEDLQKYVLNFAKVFITVLKYYSEQAESIKRNEIDRIKINIERVAVTKTYSEGEDEKLNSFLVFIMFLKTLMDNADGSQEESSDLVIKYNMFKDIIEDVKWVFEIKENSDKFVFPIHDLILSLVRDFKIDKDNMIHLAITLQLYNDINNNMFNSEDDNEIKRIIMDISNKYNVKCLEYLVGNGKLLNFSEDDCSKNGTLIFKLDNKILIRNCNEKYFNNFGKEIHAEKNSNDHEIAYFIEETICPNEDIISFKEIMESSNNVAKCHVVSTILNGCYNVLYGDTVIVNKDNKNFVRMLNRFGKNDKYIVFSKGTGNCEVENNGIEGFIKAINQIDNGLRATTIKTNGLNILSLDFLLQFHARVSSKFEFIPDASKINHESIFQNQIIESFFNSLDLNDWYILKSAINSYYSFVKEYILDLNSPEILISRSLGLIFPYKYYVPFANIDQLNINELLNRTYDDPKIEKIQREGTPIENFYFMYENTKYRPEMLDFDDNKLNVYDIDRNIEIIAIVDIKNNKAYYDEEFVDMINKLNHLIEQNDNNKLDFKYLGCIENSDLKYFIKLIDAIPMDIVNYSTFRSQRSLNNECIVPYKLLWVFRIFIWAKSEAQIFIDLILKRHYTESATDVKRFANQWFDCINEIINHGDTLVFAKCKNGDQGTLKNMLSDYLLSNASREEIANINDVNMLNTNIKLDYDSDSYTYNGKEIKNIIMLTDVIMGGSSTSYALKYYLLGGNDRYNQYIDFEHKINTIMSKNKIEKLQVQALWGYSSGKEAIQNEYANVEVVIENEIKDDFTLKEDDIDNIEKLFPRINDKKTKCLFFRAYNMPAKTIFPDFLLDTKKLIGLFNRKTENN